METKTYTLPEYIELALDAYERKIGSKLDLTLRRNMFHHVLPRLQLEFDFMVGTGYCKESRDG